MNVKKNILKRNNFFNEKSSLETIVSKTKKQPGNNLIPAANRLENVVLKFSFQNKDADIPEFFSSTPKINCITYIGEISSFEAKKKYFSQRLGKDKQNIFHLRGSLLPNISVNSDFISFNNGEINHDFNNTSFGQENDIITISKNKFVPFNDRLSKKFSPKEFIESNQKTIAYPNLTNGNENFINLKNPDSTQGTKGGPERNGTIDVFGTVTSLINTSPSDIHLLGIRCNYGVIDQEILQYDRSRGSSIVDNKYEIKQSTYVFFEDSQEIHMSSPVGTTKKSEEGFISNSKYLNTPFTEKIINEEKYSLMSVGKTKLLLSSSNSNISEIGTRFKSATSGFVKYPFYTSLTQNNLGIDSIAFKGLMRG